MGGAYSTGEGEEESCRLLVAQPEGTRPLERPKRRWVDNNKWMLERWYRLDWSGSG
jgi:outer membrane lipoprotein-sorting protein